MGMAASQARLMSLINRQVDVQLKMTTLSNQKMSLTRDMQKVSKEYQNALSSKVLKWSTNGGVSYTDMNYSNLMKPSQMNQNESYLLTDLQGRVVMDSSYLPYAQMISADGSPSNNWDSVRTSVISSITGIPAEKIASQGSYSEEVAAAKAKADALKTKKPSSEHLYENSGIKGLLGKIEEKGVGVSGLKFSEGKTWQDAYMNANSTIHTKGKNIGDILTYLHNNLAEYLPNREAFDKAFNTMKAEYELLGQEDLTNSAGAVTGTPEKGYDINVKGFIDTLMGYYQANGGSFSMLSNGNTVLDWYDVDTTAYKNWKTEYDQWNIDYTDATNAYNEAVKLDSALLTATEENMIKFYDNLFSSVAEKGWIHNEQVSDSNYLNQMLQNNMYTLTTVERDEEYNDKTGKYEFSNFYKNDIATNFTNAVLVNDQDAINEALVEYEYKKSLISEKETRIDTRLQNLQTEDSAIKQMIQGIEATRNDNTERTFKIFA